VLFFSIYHLVPTYFEAIKDNRIYNRIVINIDCKMERPDYTHAQRLDVSKKVDQFESIRDQMAMKVGHFYL
jgi:hypothetical protein